MSSIPPSASTRLSPENERLWAVLTHVSALVGILVGVGSIGWLGPLIILLVLKDRSAFVAQQAKTTLNFQITMLIVNAAALLIAIVTLGLLFFVPIAVGAVVGVLVVVLSIIAAVRAGRGEPYRYPLTITFLR